MDRKNRPSLFVKIERSLEWCEQKAQDGRMFYYNWATHQKSWQKPDCIKTPGGLVLSQCPWKECIAHNGKIYCYNVDTKKCRWGIPPELDIIKKIIGSEKANQKSTPAKALPTSTPLSGATALNYLNADFPIDLTNEENAEFLLRTTNSVNSTETRLRRFRRNCNQTDSLVDETDEEDEGAGKPPLGPPRHWYLPDGEEGMTIIVALD